MNALAKIQSELRVPKLNENKFGGYKYRSCEDILEAVKPMLKTHDATLTISDSIEAIGGRIYVKATALFIGGDGFNAEVTAFAREPESRKGMDEAQITGATSSYARKYALNGLFCIDDTKDSDATNDHGKTSHRDNGYHQTKNIANKSEIDDFIDSLTDFCADKDLDIDGWIKANSGGKATLQGLKDGKISTSGLGILQGALDERKLQ